MIEKTILDYLNSALNVPVYMEVPENPTLPFITLEKTGSSQENRVYSAMIAIQSYADSLYNAALLNESVKAAMEEIAELNDIGAAYLNGDYNYTDTQTKLYRYQAVYNVIHY